MRLALTRRTHVRNFTYVDNSDQWVIPISYQTVTRMNVNICSSSSVLSHSNDLSAIPQIQNSRLAYLAITEYIKSMSRSLSTYIQLIMLLLSCQGVLYYEGRIIA